VLGVSRHESGSLLTTSEQHRAGTPARRDRGSLTIATDSRYGVLAQLRYLMEWKRGRYLKGDTRALKW
jgi:hypothetical protein